MSGYGYGDPQPGQVWLDPGDRSTAMWAHLGALIASFVFGPLAFVVPLVIMQGQGKRSPFVREHARESLNFQLTVLIVSVAAVGCGLILLLAALPTMGASLLLLILAGLAGLAASIVAFVWEVQATMAANAGRPYRYPLSLRLVS
ncbi:MAG: uncharacterized protein QOJ92_1129 [Frankiales bacterium]|nr:uncharacterized protein [Frankiales bacterium]